MNIKLVRIADRGVPNLERLHVQALTAVNLQFYIVFNTTAVPNRNAFNLSFLYGPPKIWTTPKNVFWFPEFSVNRGDNIILYSKGGSQHSMPRGDGTQDHFFFWGSKTVLWGGQDDRATVFEIAGFETIAE